MGSFLLVFKHYFMRTLKNKLSFLVQIVLPLGIILTLIMISDNVEGDLLGIVESEIDGFNVMHTHTSVSMMLFFQLFGGMWSLIYLYDDLKKERRSRLFFAPVNKVIYPIAAIAGSWVVAILQGLIIIVGLSIFLDVHWGNIGILILVLLGISLFSHLTYALLFTATKNLNQANAIGFGFAFVMAALSGTLIGDLRTVFDSGIIDFLYEWGTPISLGRRAVLDSGIIGLDSAGLNMSSAIGAVVTLYVISAIMAGLVAKRQDF